MNITDRYNSLYLNYYVGTHTYFSIYGCKNDNLFALMTPDIIVLIFDNEVIRMTRNTNATD